MVDFGTFFIDGKSAKKMGITLQKEIEVSAPKPIIHSEQVPGRNGEILYNTGAYSNRTIKASCFVLKPKAMNYIFELNAFLAENVGYRKLEISSIPDRFFMARTVNGANFDVRAKVLAPFNLTFDCKPQAFLNSGDKFITLNNVTQVYNPASGHAKPLIHIHGKGNIVFKIGDRQVDISGLDGDIMLDCEQQTAYYGSVNKNGYISCDEFPELQAGGSWVSWTGDVVFARMKPRWFDL